MTLRNGRWVLVGAVTLFLIASVTSEMRGHRPGEFGRLFSSRTIDAKATPRKLTVVEEKVIKSGTADPLLIEGLDREEILGVEEPLVEPLEDQQNSRQNEDATFSTSDSYNSMRETERLTPRRQGSQWVITGGASGVVVQEKPDN